MTLPKITTRPDVGLLQLQAPAGAPVSVEDAKLHLRIDGDAENVTIERLVKAATSNAERLTNRAFITQRWALTLDRFPGGNQPIKIPLPPLKSVEAIKYFDSADAEQTLPASDYVVDPTGLVGKVQPAWQKSWPATSGRPMAVRIEFTAGYGEAAAVPADIVSAILLLVGSLDQNREAVVIGTIVNELPMGVEYLLSPYVIPSTP